MNKDSNYYVRTPVGKQLSVHFENRAELRRTMPLIPFSFSCFLSALSAGSKGWNQDRCETRTSKATS